MNDTQILTLALSIAIPLGLLLYSNSRVTEAKETLRAEIRAAKAEIELKLDRLDQKLDSILRILADHEAKLQR